MSPEVATSVAPVHEQQVATTPTQGAANGSLYLGIAAQLAAGVVAFSIGWLTPALILIAGGITYGIIGLLNTQKGAGGAVKARFGLVLSSTALISIIVGAYLTSTGQNLVFDKIGVETQMAASFIIAPQSVACPETPSMEEGNTFNCIATFSDGTSTTIYVKVQDTSGNITWSDTPQ
jgi:hypothetical protein